MTRWKLIVESGEEKRVNVCDAAVGECPKRGP